MILTCILIIRIWRIWTSWRN